MDDRLTAKLELGLGAALVPTPFWVIMVQDVSMIAGLITAVCGAIIGLHAVYRLCRRATS